MRRINKAAFIQPAQRQKENGLWLAFQSSSFSWSLALDYTCCSQYKIFSPPNKRLLFLCLALAHFLQVSTPRPNSLKVPAPGRSQSDACNCKSSRRKQLWAAGIAAAKGPTYGFRGCCQSSRPPTRGPPAASVLLRAPGRASGHRSPLTCSAASFSVAVHLDSILEHPFFSAFAASCVTSSGGGLHTAT